MTQGGYAMFEPEYQSLKLYIPGCINPLSPQLFFKLSPGKTSSDSVCTAPELLGQNEQPQAEMIGDTPDTQQEQTCFWRQKLQSIFIVVGVLKIRTEQHLHGFMYLEDIFWNRLQEVCFWLGHYLHIKSSIYVLVICKSCFDDELIIE